MNCPNCGAATFEDNLGRWFCSQGCGWNSGYTKGVTHELRQLRGWSHPGPGRPVVLHQSVRMGGRGCPQPYSGTVPA